MGGAAVLADHIPNEDATVVTRLAEAGAVLLGKLNLTEGAMGGYNPQFEAPLNPWNPGVWSGASSSGSGVRIGFDEQEIRQHTNAELAEAVASGVRVLEQLGAEVIEIQLPDLDEFLPAWPILCSAEAVLAHEATYPSRREEYGPWFRGWLDMGTKVSGAEYARANNLRAACNGRFREIFETIDVLACPSMTGPPSMTPEESYGPMDDYDPSVQRFTIPFDFNGTPTLSVPCGFNQDGLPLSLQFVGHPLREPLLCQVGHAYEEATEWHTLRPNLEEG